MMRTRSSRVEKVLIDCPNCRNFRVAAEMYVDGRDMFGCYGSRKLTRFRLDAELVAGESQRVSGIMPRGDFRHGLDARFVGV